MQIGQFNGADTALDIAVASQFFSNAIVILDVEVATRSIGSMAAIGVGTLPKDLAVADVNGDGADDLVFANQGALRFQIKPCCRGMGRFPYFLTKAMGSSPLCLRSHRGGKGAVSIVTGEFTGDSLIDVAVAHSGTKFGDDASR